jgi:hypothetical protein
MTNCNCQARGSYRTPRRTTYRLACVLLAMAGCASPQRHAERIARDNGFEDLLLQGSEYQHRAFASRGRPSDPLVVFIDGDGSPWIDGGRHISADPTPRVPLALAMATVTPVSALYLSRPCYLMTVLPANCSERLWTSERYSSAVVASMSVAASAYISEHHVRRVLLVGFSGGGALAVLMAPSVPNLVGVVTIAGNLDSEEWTRLHGYLPLNGSLNPALEPPLPASLKQWYLVGGRDTNVPPETNERYFRRIAADRARVYPGFDHTCCWVAEWPSIFADILAELNSENP